MVTCGDWYGGICIEVLTSLPFCSNVSLLVTYVQERTKK